MSFDFTTLIDRRQYPGKKWHLYAEDVLPLWVADMDFETAPVVTQALHQMVEIGIYGYVAPMEALKKALCAWAYDHHGWAIEPQWQAWMPGVVPALNLMAQALTEPGDALMTVTPIYPPFLGVGNNTQRELITVPMLPPSQEDPHWRLDREAFETLVTPKTRLLLWCNPHNPTGRVFNREELEWLADFVERHDLLVCSDELHCDLVLDAETRHVPLAALNERIAQRTITLWAASKTFNVAGLPAACAIIPDASLRERAMKGCDGFVPSHNLAGLVAAQVAYQEGEAWRQQLLEVLVTNRDLLAAYVAKWPGVSMIPQQATYLSWLDFRDSGLGDVPQQALLERARVGLSDGADFGQPGFVRMNIATQTERLRDALERMDKVLG